MEYIKFFWKYIDEETPVLLFYEVDVDEERYATRMIEVYKNRTIKKITEEGVRFITEAPVPTVDEINMDMDFFACTITREEFEELYDSNGKKYNDSIEFPVKQK